MVSYLRTSCESLRLLCCAKEILGLGIKDEPVTEGCICCQMAISAGLFLFWVDEIPVGVDEAEMLCCWRGM